MADQIVRPPLGSPFDKNVTAAVIASPPAARAFNATTDRDTIDDLNAAFRAVGLDFKGAYAGATTYAIGEYVLFSRGLYRKATAAIAGTAPVAGGTADWTEVAPPSAAPVHTHDDRYFTEAESDARFAALAHTHTKAQITDFAHTHVQADLPASTLAPVATSFTANGDAYFPAHEAMTLNLASTTQAGTGTIAFAKALAATPTTFAAVSTSTSFAAGDVLRITCSAITGYKAVTIPRTA